MERFACVTGTDKGLGFELVKVLLNHGYVVFAGRYLKESTDLEHLKIEYPHKLHVVEMDNSSDLSVKAACNYIAAQTDKLDILINNAGILGNIESTVEDELDFDEMQRVYNVNTLGALRVSNSFIKLILNSEYKLIVNITSEAGSIGNCYRHSWFAYCMSKAALNMQATIIHNQIEKKGGQVLLIHPGHMKTFMRGKLDEAATLTPEFSAEHIMKIIVEHEKYKAEKPAYIDIYGDVLSW